MGRKKIPCKWYACTNDNQQCWQYSSSSPLIEMNQTKIIILKTYNNDIRYEVAAYNEKKSKPAWKKMTGNTAIARNPSISAL